MASNKKKPNKNSSNRGVWFNYVIGGYIWGFMVLGTDKERARLQTTLTPEGPRRWVTGGGMVMEVSLKDGGGG